MSTANRVIKNSIYLYVRMAVSIIFSFFTTRILLQSLGANDYGLYNVVAGTLSMLNFLSASMSSATQRFISHAEGEGDFKRIAEIFNNAVFLHRMIGWVVCAFFVLGGFVFFNGVLNIDAERTVVAIAVYACMIFSTVFAITIAPYDAVLNAHENMKYYSLLGIADVLMKFVIAIMVMLCENLDQLLLYGILMAFESWLFRFITQRYCVKHYVEVREINRLKYVNKDTLRTMTSFAGWNLLNISSGMICLYGINIIVNHYFDTTVNAAIGVATQFTGVLMGVIQNMSKALTPVLVKSEGAKNREKVLELSYKGCKFSYLLFAIICIPLIPCLPKILQLWLVDVPHYTYEFCIVMILSLLVEQACLFLQQTINAEGNIKEYSIYKFIFNLVPIPASIICFQFYHDPTYAWIIRFVFFVLIGSIINIIFSIKNTGLKFTCFFNKAILPCLILTVIITITSYLINHTGNFNFIVCYMLCIIIILPFVYVLGLDKNERGLIKGILHRQKY